MDILHKHTYSIEESLCSLVPSTGPMLCRDEIEDWSASEANLFEEALDKYGKDFNDIRQDFVSGSLYEEKNFVLITSCSYSCHGKPLNKLSNTITCGRQQIDMYNRKE